MRIGLVVALAACHSPSVSFDDAQAADLAATCERFARCGLYVDEVTCETDTRQITDQNLAAAVASGKVHYDGTQAKQCYDAISSMSCDATTHDVKNLPAACAKILSGTIADDDACDFDTECTSGTCVPTTTCIVGMCCAGTCQSPTPSDIGGTCQTSRDCVTGAFCTENQVCAALGMDGDNCFTDPQCADGFGCITATFPGVCRALPALGAACPDGRCADIGASCNAVKTCVAAGLPGDACTTAADCSSLGRCDTANHVCADLPAVGAHCDGSCQGNAWCDLTNTPGVCAAPLSNTLPCNSDDECSSNYCADGPVFDDCAVLPVCT